MSHFDFVRATLPSVYADCARAESYLSSDPRSACFYSRRAVEGLVGHLYDVLDLALPYQDDLAARREVNAVNGTSATSASEIHRCSASSQIALG